MTFKLKSGNRTSFKSMGSSPLKASANYSDKAQNLLKAVPNKDAYNKLSDADKQGFDKAAEKYGLPTKKESPAKQKLEKGQGKLIKGEQNWPGETEGQDENKIFNEKGKHVGDWVNGKKVMHETDSITHGPKKSPAKQYAKKTGPRANPKGSWKHRKGEESIFEGRSWTEKEIMESNEAIRVRNKKIDVDKTVDKAFNVKSKKYPPHQLESTIRKKSPMKQTDTTWADGSKKSKRQVEEQKMHPDEYWYKINGKKATKAEYIKYQNDPAGDEPGKQTNNPDVYGRRKDNQRRGSKTN